jgi:hypothetical protein
LPQKEHIVRLDARAIFYHSIRLNIQFVQLDNHLSG